VEPVLTFEVVERVTGRKLILRHSDLLGSLRRPRRCRRYDCGATIA
jgi:hypothetical protein